MLALFAGNVFAREMAKPLLYILRAFRDGQQIGRAISESPLPVPRQGELIEFADDKSSGVVERVSQRYKAAPDGSRILEINLAVRDPRDDEFTAY
jgi:hypothetical protein